jgi:exopolyphosphatase/guanosine-5'-triphosphate,3'-diphosphate pyrophosphatase
VRVAAIDIGTNTTRLIVADIEAGELRELERRTAITRLGEGVDSSGRLAPDAIARVHETLAEYRTLIDVHKPDTVLTVATSAVRDATNGARFLAEIEDRFDTPTRLLSGEEEALLAFRGSTYGRTLSGRVLVVDIGGGSTELVLGDEYGPVFNVSLDVGAVRLTERFLHSDPPSKHELARCVEAVWSLIDEHVPTDLLRTPEAAIGNAGTVTTIAALAQDLPAYDRERVHGYRISREAVGTQLARLASLPLAERRKVPALEPERAPVIVAGAIVLRELLDAFSLAEIEASELDILDGAALLAGDTAGEPDSSPARPE